MWLQSDGPEFNKREEDILMNGMRKENKACASGYN